MPRLRDEKHVLDLVVWLLGDSLEELVRAALERLSYAEGMTAAERGRRGPELARERERLVGERERLTDEAISAGVAVSHLPETVRRREAVAEARAREELARKRQEEAAAEIDAAHVERTVGRSTYLGVQGR